jgi:hypothetical protein
MKTSIGKKMAKKPNKENPLIKKLLNATKNSLANTVPKSEILNNTNKFLFPVPVMNAMFSGDLDIGMTAGINQLVGKSKSFKSIFLALMMKAYLDRYDDAVGVLEDSEGGTTVEYFDTAGFNEDDKERVIHSPVATVEDLTISVNQRLDQLTRGQHAFFAVDSVGLLPSCKEKTDAIKGDEKQDMTRARAVNSFARTVINPVKTLDIPLVVINHYYESMKAGQWGPPEKIIKGGEALYLASDTILLISTIIYQHPMMST